MDRRKGYLPELGLLIITVWAALQYVFLANVPDNVSTFFFIGVTNLVGLIILGLTKFKKFRLVNKKTLFKGAILAGELIGYNFFVILGSKNMDTVVIASVVSMYFIFIPPIMLLMRKKISFRSVIASSVAIIALLLMFEADTSAIFSSRNVVYLIICDMFFAVYVITVSIFSKDEDSVAITLSQMIFSCIFAFAGWGIEVILGRSSFAFPKDGLFWITVLFIGVFIRALYGIIQVGCQKYVAPITTSLIFSSEIIITLLLNPLMSKLLKVTYNKADACQITGCVLFVIAILIVDDTFMAKFGYNDMEEKTIVDSKGNVKTKVSISRRLINTTLGISMVAVVVCVGIFVYFIYDIRDTVVSNSEALGEEASTDSATALKNELEIEMTNTVTDKALLADAKLNTYMVAAKSAADYAVTLLENPEDFVDKETFPPDEKNKDIWVMQRTLSSKAIKYKTVEEQNKLLGNMINSFKPIVENNGYILTIYIATEEGLMIAYDPNSINNGEEDYYDFFSSSWYEGAKEYREAFYTSAYQDGYGRGLTISCVSPVIDSKNNFRGAIGIDILIKDMNESMVSDGIFDPARAILFDEDGFIIASKDTDDESSGTLSIYDSGETTALRDIADIILSGEDGITVTPDGELYVAYAYIPLTEWIMCVTSPVANIVAPAEKIEESIIGSTQEIEEDVVEKITIVVENGLIILAVIILLITYFIGRTTKKITTPLTILEKDVLEISKGNLNIRTSVDTADEVGSLAIAFNSMTESLQKYIVDLKEATAKEERIASELHVATKIQADMLPSDFPAFPDRKDFDLYATMDPAKEVGGDFYDFFLVDENHLALVMADVSGKGVPAALFMAISKALIKSRTLMGGSPGEILTDVNNQLAESNKEDMFVTVWLGVLNLKNGLLVSANAGHEYPIIKTKDGFFEIDKKKHQMVLGGLEGIKYKNFENQINPGDIIYLYTDGVPEATNAEESQYGMERLVTFLNYTNTQSMKDMLLKVREDIDSFVDGAEQFDDITMLGLVYNGGEEESHEGN